MYDILCYGDSNTWGAQPVLRLGEVPQRWGLHDRWAGVLRDELGEGYWVVEDGLNGRTTVWADPVEGKYKCGKADLMGCLEAHMPLDLVILMLGTNDTKPRFAVPPRDIATSVRSLVDLIRHSGTGPRGGAPQTLLIAPAPLTHLTELAEIFAGGVEKSQRLGEYYRQVAAEAGCAFLDAGELVCASDRDGTHLEVAAHAVLGHAVAAKVRELLPR